MRLNHERGLPRAAAGARGQPLVSVKKKHKATSKNHANKLKNDKKITAERRKGQQKHAKQVKRNTENHEESKSVCRGTRWLQVTTKKHKTTKKTQKTLKEKHKTTIDT